MVPLTRILLFLHTSFTHTMPQMLLDTIWYDFCVGVSGGCCWPGLKKFLYWWRSQTPIALSSPCPPSTSSAGAYWLMVSQTLPACLTRNFHLVISTCLTGLIIFRFIHYSLSVTLLLNVFPPFFLWIGLNEDQNICLQTCHSLQVLSSSLSTELLQRWLIIHRHTSLNSFQTI